MLLTFVVFLTSDSIVVLTAVCCFITYLLGVKFYPIIFGK